MYTRTLYFYTHTRTRTFPSYSVPRLLGCSRLLLPAPGLCSSTPVHRAFLFARSLPFPGAPPHPGEPYLPRPSCPPRLLLPDLPPFSVFYLVIVPSFTFTILAHLRLCLTEICEILSTCCNLVHLRSLLPLCARNSSHTPFAAWSCASAPPSHLQTHPSSDVSHCLTLSCHSPVLCRPSSVWSSVQLAVTVTPPNSSGGSPNPAPGTESWY